MRVRTQPMQGGRPTQCHMNVGKRIKALGGSAVFGSLARQGSLHFAHAATAFGNRRRVRIARRDADVDGCH
jgi:hypothetical protein